jgi:hypothetical protein
MLPRQRQRQLLRQSPQQTPRHERTPKQERTPKSRLLWQRTQPKEKPLQPPRQEQQPTKGHEAPGQRKMRWLWSRKEKPPQKKPII